MSPKFTLAIKKLLECSCCNKSSKFVRMRLHKLQWHLPILSQLLPLGELKNEGFFFVQIIKSCFICTQACIKTWLLCSRWFIGVKVASHAPEQVLAWETTSDLQNWKIYPAMFYALPFIEVSANIKICNLNIVAEFLATHSRPAPSCSYTYCWICWVNSVISQRTVVSQWWTHQRNWWLELSPRLRFPRAFANSRP